ncbi:MAG: prepilin-type N-terminal cleavage/methylation domain-containing protein [Dehalococcoidia bacterium]|nr:MAG: prepilin-type N-terminal cleavage/methylation domain-containing protein [Dehalococcoidia bacterium]
MRGKRGFTLIEVLIVVIILGILATIAVPQFTKLVARSRTAEAYVTLGAIKTGEEIYRLEGTGYTATLTDLDIIFPDGGTGSPNFDYTAVADATTYTITATGKESAVGVVVTLEQDGTSDVTIP